MRFLFIVGSLYIPCMHSRTGRGEQRSYCAIWKPFQGRRLFYFSFGGSASVPVKKRPLLCIFCSSPREREKEDKTGSFRERHRYDCLPSLRAPRGQKPPGVNRSIYYCRYNSITT
ncbi:hypothetical protein GGR52DRAFT_537416 [Hypoxylon sp. FL1284]|nr:hypothetical protein GGR52DRAFT_537416 [Hypoxylon sp. FL1284]